jgi:PAS domain S-box-containing protein
LTGWNFDEAKNQPLPTVFKIINALTRAKVENPVEKVLATGQIIGLANHTVLISKNGAEYQIADSAAPIRDKEGNTKGVILVFSDVTEKYAAEEAVRKSEENLRKTLDKTPFPIAVVDLQDDKIFFWSHSALELFGHTAQTASQWYALAYPDPVYRQESIARWKPFLEKARQSGQTVNTGEYCVTCKDGSERICEIYATLLPDYLIVTFNDITQRKQAETNLKQIEWMLSPENSTENNWQFEHDQGYGDLIALNQDGLILKSIGLELLRSLTYDYMELLGTSSAIYEKNGDYAFGIFTSGWCRMMDSASRKRCNTPDNSEALKSGQWLCHESCWTCSKEAIAQSMPFDIECAGGLRIYAEPIIVGGKAVGAINFGYGNPPVSKEKLQSLAEKFQINYEELVRESTTYETRPPYIINMAKKRLHTTALLIASIIETKLAEKILQGTKQLLADSEQIGKVGGWEFNMDTLAQNWTDETFRIHEVELSFDHTVANGINFYAPHSRPIIENAVQRAIEFNEPFDLDLEIITAKGNLRHVHTIGKIDLANRRIYGFFQDITERKIAEEALRKSEEKYRLQFMNMDSYNSMYEVVTNEEGLPCDFRFIMVNQAYENYVGKKASELIGKTLLEVYPQTEQYWIDKMSEAVLTGAPLHFENFSHVMNTYTEINLYTPQKGYLAMTTANIMGRKLAEEKLRESELTFKKLFEDASDAILLIDDTGVFVECNQAALDLLKMTREQVLFIPPVKISPEFQPNGRKSEEAALEMIELAYKKGNHRFDWTCVNAQGIEFIVEVSLMPIMIKGKTMLHTTWRNITERKQAEAEIKRQLAEKEILLKEVQHRIKNNIASIEKLLSLQATATDNTAAKTVLQEAISRVQSIRVLYEKLLIGKDCQNVSIKSYTESLVDCLLAVFPESKTITIEKKIADFKVHSSLVIPIGIIINELLTNIFKYAFKVKNTGYIAINLDQVGNHVTLTIQDDGIGIDERITDNKSPGFGLTLVKMLAEQLQGTFTVENDNGTKNVLKFTI